MNDNSPTRTIPNFPQHSLIGLFFGLYHIWQLFSFPTIFLLGVVLGYVVWWKREIRVSISLHVFQNVLMGLMYLMAALAM